MADQCSSELLFVSLLRGSSRFSSKFKDIKLESSCNFVKFTTHIKDPLYFTLVYKNIWEMVYLRYNFLIHGCALRVNSFFRNYFSQLRKHVGSKVTSEVK